MVSQEKGRGKLEKEENFERGMQRES